ncbi:MAG: hypothetical protein HC819_13780 [Cyclobacteriaceae bacterium]|nr:hypothetical protein [Cyclobacteriaceae bacterium]
MAYTTEMVQKYTFLWSKYRPALLRFMIDAEAEPQEYQFLDHEFKSINAKEKGGYSFVLRVFQGKAINDIKSSALAKDLLSVLQKSRKAVELMDQSVYEFTMNKQFMLEVKQEEAPVEE